MAMRNALFMALVNVGLLLSMRSTAAEPNARDLAEFRTVDTCLKTEVKAASGRTTQISPGRTGYLGISTKKNEAGRLLVTEVATDSPADKAGLIPGDEILTAAGTSVDSTTALRDLLQSLEPGKDVTIAIRCGEHERRLSAQLEATSKPLSLNPTRVVLGIRLSDVNDVGALIQGITDNGPAAKAGLKSGDVIAKVDGLEMSDSASLRDALANKSPG